MQLKCAVAYAKDKCSAHVYANITFFTDIDLKTIQIIEFSKSVASCTAYVDCAVCDSDADIIEVATTPCRR